MKLSLCVATMQTSKANHYPGKVDSWVEKMADQNTTIHIVQNGAESNLGVVGSYQAMYENSDEEILCYVHDDVTQHEKDWDLRILNEFSDPGVGVVGLGGALWHGTNDIYKTPYRLGQLARHYYSSNVDDAEVHGARFTGACDVAVLDGFCLAVRRDLLDKCGGWPTDAIRFHCYDYFICAAAHRHGYRVRVVGLRCHHHGGGTSTTPAYQEWATRQGESDVEAHERSHRWFYEEFRDTLPWRCPTV